MSANRSIQEYPENVNVTTTAWIVTVVSFLAMFAIEFVLIDRRHKLFSKQAREHIFTNTEAIGWIVFYTIAALGFSAYLWMHYGQDYGQQFLAGWLTEYSLSTDNVFVFAVILTSFAVPEVLKHRVLAIGILIALLLRSILIFIGAQAIHKFEVSFLVFSLFLFYLAYSVWKSEDSEPDPEGNAFIRWVSKRIPTSSHYDEKDAAKFTTIDRESGKRKITPMLLVILAIGTTDLIFAIDSIPAVFGLTNEAYVVVAVNAFALFGLRQIFFLIDGLLGKVRHLSRGLSIILGFIALKMFIEAIDALTFLAIPEIHTGFSLLFIVVVLSLTVWLSARESKRITVDGLTEVEQRTDALLEQDAGFAIEDLADGEMGNESNS